MFLFIWSAMLDKPGYNFVYTSPIVANIPRCNKSMELHISDAVHGEWKLVHLLKLKLLKTI